MMSVDVWDPSPAAEVLLLSHLVLCLSRCLKRDAHLCEVHGRALLKVLAVEGCQEPLEQLQDDRVVGPSGVGVQDLAEHACTRLNLVKKQRVTQVGTLDIVRLFQADLLLSKPAVEADWWSVAGASVTAVDVTITA